MDSTAECDPATRRCNCQVLRETATYYFIYSETIQNH